MLTQAQTQIVVQLTTEIDGSGKCINWTEIAVTWDTEEYSPADIPDHVPSDDDALQEWFVQSTEVLWRKFSFEREVRGTYWLRWSKDGKLFSMPASCVVILPKEAIHKG